MTLFSQAVVRFPFALPHELDFQPLRSGASLILALTLGSTLTSELAHAEPAVALVRRCFPARFWELGQGAAKVPDTSLLGTAVACMVACCGPERTRPS